MNKRKSKYGGEYGRELQRSANRYIFAFLVFHIVLVGLLFLRLTGG